MNVESHIEINHVQAHFGYGASIEEPYSRPIEEHISSPYPTHFDESKKNKADPLKDASFYVQVNPSHFIK